jgi:hypothetical protein
MRLTGDPVEDAKTKAAALDALAESVRQFHRDAGGMRAETPAIEAAPAEEVDDGWCAEES